MESGGPSGDQARPRTAQTSSREGSSAGRDARRGRPAAGPTVVAPSAAHLGAGDVRISKLTDEGAEFIRLADRALIVVRERSTVRLQGGVAINKSHPLDYYKHRAVITAEEFDAGNTLAEDFACFCGSGVHGVNYTGFHGTTNYADNWRRTESMAAAEASFIAAVNAIPYRLRGFVTAVCVHGYFANDAARLYAITPRRGIDFFRKGLALLVKHYGAVLAFNRSMISNRATIITPEAIEKGAA